MAAQSHYEELARQLSAIGAVKRGLGRILPAECPAGSAAVLTLLGRHGEMRISRLAELLDVDMSVTSRHVTHVAARGWIERDPDPLDKRSRILRLTPAGQDMLDELGRRTAQMFARTLRDWSDDEVGQLNVMLARLRESFDCREERRVERHEEPRSEPDDEPRDGHRGRPRREERFARRAPLTRTPAAQQA